CRNLSAPLLYNDVVFGNRSYYIGVGSFGGGTLNQQKIISLYNAFGSTQAPTQASTGDCNLANSYWDIGVRGDTGPTGQPVRLTPFYSFVGTGGYAGTTNNLPTAPPALTTSSTRSP